jgi:prepilin-type N-terminal cleavage/methylation domain-containing protein
LRQRAHSFLSTHRGFTLTEIVAVSAILGLLLIPLSVFLAKTVRGLNSFTNRSLAQGDVLLAFHEMEVALRNAVLITSAPVSGQYIEFRMNATRNPAYVPISLLNPADHDNDNTLIVAPALRWTVGFNVSDDDDNNDVRIDARCKIFQQADTVFIQFSWDEGPWSTKTLLKGVPDGGLRFSYFGSVSEPTGVNLDLNADGVIDFNELDGPGPNGVLDAQERMAITTIEVWLAQDRTRRSGPIVNESDLRRAHFFMKTRVSPILLPIRARS